MREVGRSPLLSVLIGFAALYAVLNAVATVTRSNYGEGGALVFGAVLCTLLLIQGLLFREKPAEALQEAGFVRPNASGLAAGMIVTLLLLIVLVILGLNLSVQLTLREGWPVLMLGLALQGGISEEVVFRGFLFRKLRTGRTFWSAAWIAMIPFVLAHLYLFVTMEPMVATAATLVAVSTSFPLSRLFEMSGNSIWPPALVHFATHLVKLVVFAEANFARAQLFWMAAVCFLPWVVFCFKEQREVRS